MGQGNPNKVDAIVEEIVKNNTMFKLKSPVEQEKEKDSMAKSINSAISVLNEAGKELVLQDLSVDPDEKFKGFIDGVGNIDISGIIQYTTNVVKNKIEEAEREGINLRRDSVNVNKDNKTIVAETAISMAVITNMISNYEDLSDEYKAKLFDENTYKNMSDKDRRILNDKVFTETMSKNLSEKDKKRVQKNKRDFEITEAYIKLLKEKPNLKTYEEIFTELKKRHPEFSEKEIREFCKKHHNEEKKTEENIEGAKNNSLRLTRNTKAIGIICDYNLLMGNGKIKEAEELLLKYKDEIPEINKIWLEMKKNGQFIAWDETRDEEFLRGTQGRTNSDDSDNLNSKSKKPNHYKKQYGMVNGNKPEIKENTIRNHEQKKNLDECQIDFKVENFVQSEIKQVSQTLLKDGKSQEQIKNSIDAYKEIMKQLPEEYISELEESVGSDREDLIINLLVGKCHVEPEIAERLSQLKFDGQLIDMLKNEDRRAEFIEQLDQSIEQLKEQQVTDTEVQQGIKQGTIKQEDMIVATEQERTTQESQEVEQENYSFINAKYLEQDSIEGLIPRNGGNSKAIQDDKTAIFYSQGKEGAIVMYFEFLRQYENLRGERGDKALQKYEAYQNGSLQLTEEQIAQLEAQIEQIKDIRDSQNFDEFMGDKLYLKIDGLDREEDKKKADEWRNANLGTKMDYNYANSWTEETIPPDRIDVVTLQRNDGTDTRVSQKDIITYFLSQTSVEKIAELGINDTTLGLIKAYYEEHSPEIAEFGTEYSLVNQDIKEFAQSRENKGQVYGFTERSENEGQEEYIEGKSETSKEEVVHNLQDFLKFSKNEKTPMGDVKEQNDLIINIANEKVIVPGKAVEEAENDDKGQENI